MYICINKNKRMKNTNTLRRISVSIRWYFRDFFSIANGYTILPSNI